MCTRALTSNIYIFVFSFQTHNTYNLAPEYTVGSMGLTILNEKLNMHVVVLVHENLISFTIGVRVHEKSGLIISISI